MGDLVSKMTAESEPAAPQQAQYGTPQKKVELSDPRSPTQNLDRTPVVVKDAKVIDDPRSPMTNLNRTPIGNSLPYLPNHRSYDKSQIEAIFEDLFY